MLIGVFDSGIGGLTVLRALRAAWPRHAFVYLGDTARVPYGSKSRQTVVRYATAATHFLLDRGAELIVIACNTASAYGLEALKADLTVPVVGVIEPGARAAGAVPGCRHIAVIGTSATINSGAYEAAIRAVRPDVRISSRACPLFVPLADEGWENSAVARAVAEEYLAPWLPGRPDRPDALVLGCTHYPVLKPTLAAVLGPEIALIDSAEATAAALAPYLDGNANDNPARTDVGSLEIFVTDGAPGFSATAARLLRSTDATLQVVDL